MSLCNDCKRRDDCMDRDKLDMTEGCGDYKPVPDPRDRELEILRAQVNVAEQCLGRGNGCPPCAVAKCFAAGSKQDCIRCWSDYIRQQAEKSDHIRRQAEKEVWGEG